MKSYQLLDWRQPLTLVDIPTPEPKGSELLLKVVASGICHTDLHLIDGGYDLGQGRRLSFKDRGFMLPRTLGHEIVGRVVAAGPEAGSIAREKNYLVFPWIGCGTCVPCAGGDEHLCPKPRYLGLQRDGGFSDHVLVPHPRYLLDIGNIDPKAAAPYACSGLTTYSALKKAGNALQHSEVVVIGAGGLGLMCVQLIRLMGGKGAVIVDIDAKKRQAAMEAGALAALDGNAADVRAQIQSAVSGGVQVVIDLVASSATASLALDVLAKGGKYIVVGMFGGSVDLPLPTIPLRVLTISGSFVGNLTELTELLELAKSKGLPPFPITSCSLHDANDNLQRLHDGKIIGRAVMLP